MTAPQPPAEPIVVIDGIPVFGPPAPWKWTCTVVPGASSPEGRVFLLRLFTATGLAEVWADEKMLRYMVDKVGAQITGIEIARDIPPNGAGPADN